MATLVTRECPGSDPSNGIHDAFHTIFENAPSALCISGLDRTLLRMNGAFCRMLGISTQELSGKSWADVVHPDDLELLLTALDTTRKGEGGRCEIEIRLVGQDAKPILTYVRVSLVMNLHGEATCFAVFIEDITERNRMTAALRNSDSRFKSVADSCPSMMWVTDQRGNVQFVNRAYRTFCEIGETDVDRTHWERLIYPADAPEYAASLRSAIAENQAVRAEARIQLRPGDWRLIGSTAEPFLSVHGEYLGHVGLSADITERVEKEKTRQSELSLIRAIHNESLEGILVVNEEGLIVAVNQPFMELWGIRDYNEDNCSAEEITGAPARPLFLSIAESLAEPEEFMRKVDGLYAHPDEREYREIELTDGRTIEGHSSGLRCSSGEYLGRVWYFRDVTTHKRVELSLRSAKHSVETANRQLQSKQMSLERERQILHALIDNVPDFMYVKDTESRFVVANAHTARVMGVSTPEELVGKADSDFFPAEMAKQFYEDEQALLRSGEPLYNREEECFDEEGREIRILTTKVPIRDEEGRLTGIAGVGRNITARKEMEIALREAEQKYRGIFDNAIVGIFQSTPEGRFLSVNPSMASILGYQSPEEMVELVTDIAHEFYVKAQYREDFKARIASQGGIQSFECETLRKDGSKIWLSMSVRGIFVNGEVVRYEGMCEDITESKLLRDQLLQAQKLESVGQLAAGIAHEINTPTQYVGDNTQFVQQAFFDLKDLHRKFEGLAETARRDGRYLDILEDISKTAESIDAAFLLGEIPKAIEQALEGLNRIATLVSAMKEFSHPGTKEKIPLDLNHAVQSSITVSRNEWKYVADVETDFDETLPQVPCLPAEFNQVILNLIVNAAHAIGDVVGAKGTERGKIIIQTRNMPACAEIRIKDSGTGIPKEIQNRVFDPFFTTKEIGKGTGQGLAIARSVVVDKHGGTIRFETEEGKGTTFIICLPYSNQKLASGD